PETPVPIEHPALLSTKARALARDTAERGGEPRATRADRARSPGPRGRRGGAGRTTAAPGSSCPVLPPGLPARLRLPAVVVPGVVGDGDRNAAVAADDRARGGVNTNRHIAVGAASAGGADVHHPVPIGPQSAGLQGVVHRSTGRTRPLRHTPNIVNTDELDRKSTRLNSSHVKISYAVFCLKKKKKTILRFNFFYKIHSVCA